MKQLSIGDNLFILSFIIVILAYALIDEYLDQNHDESCLASGACEYVEDEDGDIVVRVKLEEEGEEGG